MLTSVQLFRYERKLTACALGEPSLTLVQNDKQFGLLLASGAHGDSFTPQIYLDVALYLRIAGKTWSYTDLGTVRIFEVTGMWFAQELRNQRYLRNPSQRPYHVIFISREEYQRLLGYRAEGLALPVFQAAQQHFGRLPGFWSTDNILEAPNDYALRADVLADSVYVPE